MGTVEGGAATSDAGGDPLPSRLRGRTGVAYRALLGGSLVALAYLVVLAGYLTVTSSTVIDPGRAAYPLAWLVASGGAIAAVGRSTRRVSAVEAAVAGGYVLLLAWVAGGLSVGPTGVGIDASGGLPGWGPVIAVEAVVVSVLVVPFQFVGHLTLGVLLARALPSRSGSAAAGVVGLLSCAGCVLPLLAGAASIGLVPAFAGGLPYSVSTLAFVVTAALLVAVIVRGRTRGACTVDR